METKLEKEIKVIKEKGVTHIYVIFFAVALAVSLLVTFFLARVIFNSSTKKELLGIAKAESLELNIDLDSQHEETAVLSLGQRELTHNYKMYIVDENLKIIFSSDIKQNKNVSLKEQVKDLKNYELNLNEANYIKTKKAVYYILPSVKENAAVLVYRSYTFLAFIKNGLVPLISMIAVVLIIMVVISIVLLLNPIKVLGSIVTGIASGNADLTKRIVINEKTSIRVMKKLVNDFNSFIIRLQEIIINVKKSKDALVNYGDLLKSSTEDSSFAINEIKNNIEELGRNLENQSASVEETAGAMHQISSNINSLNSIIETQASSVQTASACIEQMLGNINSVNSSVSKLSTSFNKLESNANNGVQKQKEVTRKIEQIKYQSDALQTANEVISAIAEQTNLLAMNAAIEAAHAGEAGKGFSVVADEIRKLSETSAEQSKTIGLQLNTIHESIDSIVLASDETQNVLNSVAEDVNNTNQLVQQIENAMEEQRIGSQQISIALSDVNNNMNEVKSSSNEMSAGNVAVLEEVKVLQDATCGMKDSMNVMKDSARKIDETGSSLNSIATNLENSIKDIEQEIDQFKV